MLFRPSSRTRRVVEVRIPAAFDTSIIIGSRDGAVMGRELDSVASAAFPIVDLSFMMVTLLDLDIPAFESELAVVGVAPD